MVRLYLFVLLLLVLVLPACSNDSPEAGLREWLEASFQMDGLKLADRTCDHMRPVVQSYSAMNAALLLFGQQALGQELNMQSDLGQLRYERMSSSGNSARVRVTGELRAAIMGFSQATPIDYTANMTLENNRWKWCGP